jgi:hypothetical protein
MHFHRLRTAYTKHSKYLSKMAGSPKGAEARKVVDLIKVGDTVKVTGHGVALVVVIDHDAVVLHCRLPKLGGMLIVPPYQIHGVVPLPEGVAKDEEKEEEEEEQEEKEDVADEDTNADDFSTPRSYAGCPPVSGTLVPRRLINTLDQSLSPPRPFSTLRADSTKRERSPKRSRSPAKKKRKRRRVVEGIWGEGPPFNTFTTSSTRSRTRTRTSTSTGSTCISVTVPSMTTASRGTLSANDANMFLHRGSREFIYDSRFSKPETRQYRFGSTTDAYWGPPRRVEGLWHAPSSDYNIHYYGEGGYPSNESNDDIPEENFVEKEDLEALRVKGPSLSSLTTR